MQHTQKKQISAPPCCELNWRVRKDYKKRIDICISVFSFDAIFEIDVKGIVEIDVKNYSWFMRWI